MLGFWATDAAELRNKWEDFRGERSISKPQCKFMTGAKSDQHKTMSQWCQRRKSHAFPLLFGVYCCGEVLVERSNITAHTNISTDVKARLCLVLELFPPAFLFELLLTGFNPSGQTPGGGELCCLHLISRLLLPGWRCSVTPTQSLH